MSGKACYEFDSYRDALIRIPEHGQKQILYRSNLRWEPLLPEKHESYCRAIYLGQGCWERLTTLSEEETQQILEAWGYPEKD